jgi:CRISPR-associated protein Cmr3
MTAVVLLPRDGLFLKDGREWASDASGRAHSLGWPAPSTLLGALCTATGRMQEIASRRPLNPTEWWKLRQAMRLDHTLAVRRPVRLPVQPMPQRSAPLQARRWTAADRMWPVPADAAFMRNNAGQWSHIQRLDPVRPDLPTLGADDNPAREHLWRPTLDDQGKPAGHREWWPEATFLRWLTAPDHTFPWSDALETLGLERHTQVHVGITPASQAAEDGRLFAHDVVETIEMPRDRPGHEWGIACRFTAPGKAIAGRVTVGGDRRVAGIEAADDALFAFPDDVTKAFEAHKPHGLRLIAVPGRIRRGMAVTGIFRWPHEVSPRDQGDCRQADSARCLHRARGACLRLGHEGRQAEADDAAGASWFGLFPRQSRGRCLHRCGSQTGLGHAVRHAHR